MLVSLKGQNIIVLGGEYGLSKNKESCVSGLNGRSAKALGVTAPLVRIQHSPQTVFQYIYSKILYGRQNNT